MGREGGLRERKKQETRERIRATALRLYLERGFEDVSVTEVAEVAGVSKMTVFNYFPAKEDMFFEGTETIFPDLAGAVRDRADGQPVVRALRGYVRAELERRAEWTGLHDGVAHFARLVWASPALLAGATRRWQGLRDELVRALGEAAGLPPDHPSITEGSIESQMREALRSAPDDPDRSRPCPMDPAGLVPRLIADQILAIVQTLASANQLSQARGFTADEAHDDAIAAADLAFDLLEFGLAEQPATGSAPLARS